MIVVLAVAGMNIGWGARDEWKGPVVQTCGHYGL